MLISIIVLVILLCISLFINYRQNLLLSQYENFILDFAERINDFNAFLNSILKMNILYFDETIFELVEKVKMVKKDLADLINSNEILFDKIDMNVEEEKLDQSDEQEVLGVVKPVIYPRGTNK